MKNYYNRNKWCFGLGTVGRDALYTLVSMYLMAYLTEVVGLSNKNLAIVTSILFVFRVIDSINDPFVGTFVDSTNTRWGKFKPWIFGGMIAAGVFTVLLFHNFDMSPTAYIILFAVTYFLWSTSYTVNDISYWSLMPAVSKDQKEREGIGAISRICASVGLFAVVLLYTMVPDLFAPLGLDKRNAYLVFAIILVLLMWGFQSFTLLGVKEDRSALGRQKRTGIKEMFGILFKNDQLMVAAISMALFMIGYTTTTAFGVHYFKYAYKDEGMYMVFAAVLAVAQLSALSTFSLFRKKFSRKQLFFGAMIAVVLAYLVFFFSFEKLPLIIIAGLVLFFAQAFIQLLTLLFLADAVEYGEWKLGKRNESVSFAVQPFVNQIGSAVSSGILGLTLIISGINNISEQVANTTDPAVVESLVNSAPSSAIWIMKIAMMIFPLICILLSFFIYIKKFKIDEEMYEKIISDLEKRNSESTGSEGESAVKCD
jgi:melibiose permease/lactose/raffinose/galactose permease